MKRFHFNFPSFLAMPSKTSSKEAFALQRKGDKYKCLPYRRNLGNTELRFMNLAQGEKDNAECPGLGQTGDPHLSPESYTIH